MSTQPRVQFELPRAFVFEGEGTDYIPPASHDTSIAEARRNLPAGTLVLAQQHLGAMTAQLFIEKLADRGSAADVKFGTDVVAAALMGSARHSLRGGSPVMRRHLELPVLFDPISERRIFFEEILDKTDLWFDTAVKTSKTVLETMSTRSRVGVAKQHKFGKAAGNTALWVAMLPELSLKETDTPAMIQETALKIAMGTLEKTKWLSTEIGVNVTLATLGGPATKLTAYIEKNATHPAYNMLAEAQAQAAAIVTAA